ncbi:MAG TPA: DUF2911 domain-containing protein [Thermoanaerobaculaceae bacterium]|nr:DUF2911 domain-containing protein [Thermoanaerobaculaceae bacterium]HRS17008.1 DUF2911 domain-containing protein [Thermoanaerobaculaceae bacterium]
MKSIRVPLALAILAAALAAAPPALAQLELPRVSPRATVSQTVGLTDISIAYCRPGVKGRVIWGGLVPYDQVWRTGANEATTITFSDAVKVGGTEVPAGTYGLFTIPGKESWTVILNKGAKLWGAYEYKQEEDVLRFAVKPRPAAAHQEWMEFRFEGLSTESAEVVLAWERLEIAIPIQVEVIQRVLASARKAIAEAKVDDWRTPFRAAAFCLDNTVNLDEAGTWIDRSIAAKPTFYNTLAKARWTFARGDKAEAIALARKAIEIGQAPDTKADVAPAQVLLTEWSK